MNSVYCYSANINQIQLEDEESTEHRLSPPIILIGTHRNSFTNPTKNIMVNFFQNFYLFEYTYI
jgi:hypothetical protein